LRSAWSAAPGNYDQFEEKICHDILLKLCLHDRQRWPDRSLSGSPRAKPGRAFVDFGER
jgi:hypothetical protein